MLIFGLIIRFTIVLMLPVSHFIFAFVLNNLSSLVIILCMVRHNYETFFIPLPQELEIEHSLFSECFREVVRWNGAELHNIAAAIAGVASQVCAWRHKASYRGAVIFRGFCSMQKYQLCSLYLFSSCIAHPRRRH